MLILIKNRTQNETAVVVFPDRDRFIMYNNSMNPPPSSSRVLESVNGVKLSISI